MQPVAHRAVELVGSVVRVRVGVVVGVVVVVRVRIRVVVGFRI